MNRIRMVGMVLVATFAVSVAAASSASAALPELGRCVPAPEKNGAFKGNHCNLPAEGKGKYDWLPGPGAKPKFAGTGEAVVLETVGKRKVECGAATFEGEYTGPKTESVTVLLIGCTEPVSKQPCQTGGPPREGEIDSSGALEGELGFITGGERPTVGLDLKPKAPSTSMFVFECGTLPTVVLHAAVEGSVIGRITPINHMVEEFKTVYKAPGGKQVPQQFEGGAKDTMTAKLLVGLETKTEEIGLKAIRVDVNEESLEIKAK
jgi:hypothetical protein